MHAATFFVSLGLLAIASSMLPGADVVLLASALPPEHTRPRVEKGFPPAFNKNDFKKKKTGKSASNSDGDDDEDETAVTASLQDRPPEAIPPEMMNLYSADGHYAHEAGHAHNNKASPSFTTDAGKSPLPAPTFQAPIRQLGLGNWSIVDKLPFALVMFHAPWSASCQAYYAEFQQIGNELMMPTTKQQPVIPTFAVDVSIHHQLGFHHKINRFPQLIVLRNGFEAKASENQAPREAAALVRYMRNLLVDASHQLEKSVKELEPYVDMKKRRARPLTHEEEVNRPEDIGNVVVLTYVESATNEEIYKDVARFLQSRYRFVWTRNSDIADKLNLKEDSILVFRTDDEPVLVPTPQAISTWYAREELMKYLFTAAVPRVGLYNQYTSQVYLQNEKPLFFFFSHEAGVRLSKTVYAQLLDVAAAHPELSVVQGMVEDNMRIVSFLDLAETVATTGFGVGIIAGRDKYRFTDRIFSFAAADDFIKRFHAKQIPLHHHSQPTKPIPDYGMGEVFPLVYNTFQSYVVDNVEYDVLLLMYNPHGCPVSKDLLFMWQELAVKYKSYQRLVFATFDATNNDHHPAFQIPGVPSILYVRSNNKTMPIRFTTHTRTESNLMNFVRQWATVPVPGKNGESAPPVAAPSPPPSAGGVKAPALQNDTPKQQRDWDHSDL